MLPHSEGSLVRQAWYGGLTYLVWIPLRILLLLLLLLITWGTYSEWFHPFAHRSYCGIVLAGRSCESCAHRAAVSQGGECLVKVDPSSELVVVWEQRRSGVAPSQTGADTPEVLQPTPADAAASSRGTRAARCAFHSSPHQSRRAPTLEGVSRGSAGSMRLRAKGWGCPRT